MAAWIEQLYLTPFLLFTLVLARVSGLIMTAPIFGSKEVPMTVRAFLAMALSLLITPMQLGTSFPQPVTLVDYVILIVAELAIGLSLGLGLMILLSGIQVAGQIIAQMSGMALADVFNPGFDSEVPIFSHLLYYVTLAVFVTIGGHRKVMDALLATYASLPAGGGRIPDSIAEGMVILLTQSFVLGIRAAAPAMVALLLATVVMGLISRALPQLNVLAVGYGVNSYVTLGILMISLGAIAWVFQQHIEPVFEILGGGLTKFQ